MLGFGAFVIVFERGVYNPFLKQHLVASGDPSGFRGIPDAMYWCMATMTTVGYGDLYPVSPGGWIVGVIAMLSGTVILSLPITVRCATHLLPRSRSAVSPPVPLSSRLTSHRIAPARRAGAGDRCHL